MEEGTWTNQQIQAGLAGPSASIRIPFAEDGVIDYASPRRIVEFDMSAGAGALLITWDDSLFALLSDREFADLTRAVVEMTATCASRCWPK